MLVSAEIFNYQKYKINQLITEEPITQQAKRPKKDDTPMEVDEDYNEVITDSTLR